jgi:phospho-N-acetylmuramoyl-pentapeptide-transferase
MLYWLAGLSDKVSLLNLFRYITVRSGGATITALAFVLVLGPAIIHLLRMRQGKGQPIRADGPKSHLLTKIGTPTMGGLMILFGVMVSVLLWANLTNAYVWVVLGVTLAYGAIGFYDDYLKVTKQTHGGFSGRARLACEAVIALAACFAIASLGRPPFSTSLAFPFFKELMVDLGWFFLVFGSFVIIGAANAVNLTDGLDGLAIGPVMINAAAYLIWAYIAGASIASFSLAAYLDIPKIASCGELSVYCGSIIGAGIGFLWYNTYPAQVFMGDVGSLALGGGLGMLAVCTKNEALSLLLGGIFFIEAASVITQVVSFKLTGKRIFLMAPIHHHFEKLGWAEQKIVVRFWIISAILGLIALSSLKLR